MRWGRIYFTVQALGGAAWWLAVFASPLVREATLGGLDPVVVAVADIPLFVGASTLAAFGMRIAAAIASGWTGCVAIALAIYATVTTEAGWGVLIMSAATAGSIVALCLMLWGRVPTERIASGPFAFRPATIRSTPAPHLAVTMGQIVVFWGFFLAVVPLALSTLEQRWEVSLLFPAASTVVGAAALAAASALGLWSAVAMSTRGHGTPLPSAMPNRLVIAGPYRWVRNPMAIAGIAQGVAVGLMLQSWLVVIYSVAGSVLWNFAIRPFEEADLEQRFGDDFRRYRETVQCWVPGVRAKSRIPASERQESLGPPII